MQGVPLSEGCTVARVCLFNDRRHSNLEIFKAEGQDVEEELARCERALNVAKDRLEAVRAEVETRIGAAEAGIFTAQRLILEDEMLIDKVQTLIRDDRYNAEGAVSCVLDEFETRLLEVDDEYIRERASDLGEVKRRVLDVLANMQPSLQCADTDHCQRGRNRIVVAEELTPALTVDLDTNNLMGLVTERGGRDSHGAILARALGIPAVSGLEGVRERFSCGTELLVNGDTGEIVIWPTAESITAARAQRPGEIHLANPTAPVEGLRVMANISGAHDLEDARHMQAEGIGLYRTEIELIAAGRMLSEDELAERYAKTVQSMNGHPVVFRLFDIGSDKPLPFLHLPPEDNPSLGWRGTRLLLGKPQLLVTQARAMARASVGGRLDVLYPMITDLAQFKRIRAAFENAIGGQPRGALRHGVLFEVPSACLQAEAIMAACDFASIGTNDLIQYLFAVDRTNAQVTQDFDPDHPVFWELVKHVVDAARRNGKSVSVCGEMGGDPAYIDKLLELGIDTVSVSPRLIPVVRSIVETGAA